MKLSHFTRSRQSEGRGHCFSSRLTCTCNRGKQPGPLQGTGQFALRSCPMGTRTDTCGWVPAAELGTSQRQGPNTAAPGLLPGRCSFLRGVFLYLKPNMAGYAERLRSLSILVVGVRAAADRILTGFHPRPAVTLHITVFLISMCAHILTVASPFLS